MSFITNRMMMAVLGVVLLTLLSGGTMRIMQQAQEQTQELTSSRLNISDAQTFEQMIAQNTLSAYSCTKNPTAFGQTLMNWEQYKNQYDLQKLREAGSDMKCQGSAFSIPFSGGAQDADGVSWNDDEEGEHSKQEFVFTERVEVSQVPKNNGDTIHQRIENGKRISQDQVLIAHNDRKEKYIYWVLMPPEVRNRYTVPKGRSISNPFNGGQKTKAMTVTVFVDQQNYQRSGETFDDHRTNDVDFSGLEVDQKKDPIQSYVFCKGTKGYIKTYTGDNAKDSDSYGPPYTVENPPGENQEKASDHENVLHPFIVITENTCGNDVDVPGADRASFLNGVDEYDNGNVQGTRIKMAVHDGNKGYFQGLDFVSEKQNKIGTFQYVESSASGERCRVTVSDADPLDGSKTFVYSEGHVITQRGPVETGAEAETVSGNSVTPNGDKAQAHILFSKFDPVTTGQLTTDIADIRGNYWRRVSGNPSPLASQRAFFKPDGSLSKKRFMFRPEGDILCGDLKGGKSKTSWVICAPGNGKNMDGKVATANGKKYVCEISSNYKETGRANWNLQSSSFEARNLKSSYTCKTDNCGLKSTEHSLTWRPGQTSGYDRVEWSVPNDNEKRVVIDMDVKKRGHLQIGAEQQGETGTSYINLGRYGGEGIYIDHGMQYHQIGTYPARGCIEGRCNSGDLKLELTWEDNEVTWTVLGRGGYKIHSSTEAFNDIDKIFFETWAQDSQQPVVEIQKIKVEPAN